MQVLSLECRNDGGPGHFQLVGTMPQEGQPLEQVSPPAAPKSYVRLLLIEMWLFALLRSLCQDTMLA